MRLRQTASDSVPPTTLAASEGQNGLTVPTLLEELLDGHLELPIDRLYFALSTPVRAIPDLIPVPLPLLTPLNGPPHKNHKSSVPYSPIEH